MRAKSGKIIEGVRAISPEPVLPADEADPSKTAKAKAKQIQQQKGKYGETKTPPFKPCTNNDAKDDTPEEPTSFVGIALVDENGKPVIGQKYTVELPDGSMSKGTLDADGTAKVEGFKEGICKIHFPDIEDDCVSVK